ncbi:MAG: sulfotransferase domain-containing protein [Anaerolineae bacterium]|nr:sulfotransferase domain-containing protein [Anaerolineae bacterium]
MMNYTPPVSCICLTRGHQKLLEEAIYGFLQQDYQGQKELIILNDHTRQTLEFNHPEVKIFNLPQRFSTVIEKRNTAVALCSHDLIFIWDDEDIYLPHRLSFSVENFDETTGFFKMDEAFVWGNGRLSGLQKNVFHNGSCWSRDRFDQVRGYDYMIDYGYDQELEHQFKPKNGGSLNLCDTEPGNVYSIYRWQYKSHNRPLFLRRRSAKLRRNKRRHIKLTPHWKYNYSQQVQQYLTKITAPNRFQNSTRTTENIRVNFLIAGAQKSGTSALDAYLRRHPEICMGERKEVHFFDNERFFNEEPISDGSLKKFFRKVGRMERAISVPDNFSRDKYDLYHTFFSPHPPQRLCGEASPTYMYWYDAPRRIWEYNPAMKIIIILRNPIDRAFSHWNMRCHNKREDQPFRDALERQMQKQKSIRRVPFQHKGRYIERGFYTEQIRRIWHYFPKEQTLFLKTEELRNEPQATIDKVCDFLGVAKMDVTLDINLKSFPYVSSLSKEDRTFLKSIYRFEIKKLERLLGWDCSEWLIEQDA